MSARGAAKTRLAMAGGSCSTPAATIPPLLPLLEEALTTLGRSRSHKLRASLLARLAGGPLRDDPSRQRRASMSEQAVQIARRVGDPALLAYALDARHMAIWGPDNMNDRFAITTEMMDLSEAAGDLERLFQAHSYRIWSLLELADPNAVAAELDGHEPARRSTAPARAALDGGYRTARTVCALLDGVPGGRGHDRRILRLGASARFRGTLRSRTISSRSYCAGSRDAWTSWKQQSGAQSMRTPPTPSGAACKPISTPS